MKKKEPLPESLADTFLNQADRLLMMTRLRIDLTASKQRLDRAYLSLGELVMRLLETNQFDLSNREFIHQIEMLKRLKQDCERIQKYFSDYDK